MINKIACLILIYIISIGNTTAQTYKIHSHNDYLQTVPFWKSYSVGVSSIEADVFLEKGKLLVAHDRKELSSSRSLEALYLKPLATSIELGLKPDSLQFLIDIKSEAYTTLDAIVELLKRYPSICKNKAVKIVISGNRPKEAEYVNYPEFIYFDYQSLNSIKDQKVLDKIALISLSFKNFTGWNGKGRLTKEDLQTVKNVVDQAHALKKPFRFWGTADSKTFWYAMAELGVDYINTDKPFECHQYLNSLPARVYENAVFSEVYKPAFKVDGKDEAPKNIILLIGDGNGLSQISATAIANGGQLSLTQIKNIGLIKTHSSDDLTTDSAAGATAMATGKKVPNRAIGVDSSGNAIPNLPEILTKRGYSCGLITSDEITGATPASFYAHQKDRSMSKEILNDLKNSPIKIFAAASSGADSSQQELGIFQIVKEIETLKTQNLPKAGYYFPLEASPAPLSDALKNVVSNLASKKAPFFLMAEGAKIDSYGHANIISGLVSEGIAFDRAISEALKFADTDGNTLVLITADHETGGLSIPHGNREQNLIEAEFTTDDHTATMIPVFAYGPGSQYFRGVYENNELFNKILTVINLHP
ncbi:hypothetical protein GCM10011506_42300 [Marivirga lumbricoides]|uniref:Alkaline phosphatase n=1 Tax=Marivirga lumbricoides TaxID=1046115 RepID=A0ABQ1N2K9_9BACT|nr:hypothetical protein GCM10011506_42300 [Marivirga lumbricoides]